MSRRNSPASSRPAAAGFAWVLLRERTRLNWRRRGPPSVTVRCGPMTLTVGTQGVRLATRLGHGLRWSRSIWRWRRLPGLLRRMKDDHTRRQI
jgi:hypothetical protein